MKELTKEQREQIENLIGSELGKVKDDISYLFGKISMLPLADEQIMAINRYANDVINKVAEKQS